MEFCLEAFDDARAILGGRRRAQADLEDEVDGCLAVFNEGDAGPRTRAAMFRKLAGEVAPRVISLLREDRFRLIFGPVLRAFARVASTVMPTARVPTHAPHATALSGNGLGVNMNRCTQWHGSSQIVAVGPYSRRQPQGSG